MKPGPLHAVALLLLILAMRPLSSLQTDGFSSSSTYWNTDGDFSLASMNPYAQKGENSTLYYAPWGSNSWGIFAFGNYANKSRTYADEYSFNATQGVAHVWVQEERRIVDPRSGTVGLAQGIDTLGGGYIPDAAPVFGRDTILVYRIMRENTAIPATLNSLAEDGIVFDLILSSNYAANGTEHQLILVVDFYIHQECGALFGGCAETNDTSLNHSVQGIVHYFGWRIHANLQEGVWVSDIVNLRWYLENSARRAYCHAVAGEDGCSLAVPEFYIQGLTATAEVFGGTAGFALDYEYLLQQNDCSLGVDAGNDSGHAMAIENFAPGFLQLNGWLGVGNSYKDSIDVYGINVTQTYISQNHTLLFQSEPKMQMVLYGPGNPPVVKADSYPNSSLLYRFSRTDLEGLWYLAVQKQSGFDAYSLNISLFKGSAPPSGLMNVPATCTQSSPSQPISTSWQLIAAFTLLAFAVIVVGRRWS